MLNLLVHHVSSRLSKFITLIVINKQQHLRRFVISRSLYSRLLYSFISALFLLTWVRYPQRGVYEIFFLRFVCHCPRVGLPIFNSSNYYYYILHLTPTSQFFLLDEWQHPTLLLPIFTSAIQGTFFFWDFISKFVLDICC
jgi:hypothetical protein